MAKRKASPRARAVTATDGYRHSAAIPSTSEHYWLYGHHAVSAALANPRRRVDRLAIIPEAADKLATSLDPLRAARPDLPAAQLLDRHELARLLPEGAVHQGLALRAAPLGQPSLAQLVAGLGDGAAVLVALDQVTDPQNVGAILRSAAAFGARAVLAVERHGAPESGALAKAASGALEHMAYLRVTNLARALDRLKAAGFWVVGLARDGAAGLETLDPGPRLVLTLGAEGSGLRRLTRERCDLLARLPTRPPIDQLNVSTAAAVALYELLGRR